MAGERLERRAVLATFSVPPDISGTFLELDGNVVVSNTGGSITATPGHVQIFGNSAGRIDGTPGQANEDLTITADGFITVTGGIGGIQRPDDLTLTSVSAQPINLQQVVSLTGDLRVTKAGAFTVGSTVTVDGDFVIDEAALVTFSGNVTVGGNLTITDATGVTFAGTLTVGGALTIMNATGTTRFMSDVSVGTAAITSTTLVQVMADFTTTGADGDGDVTFTTDQINFATASLGVTDAATSATLVIQPRTKSRALTIASPPGTPAGLSITDADISAIQPGWKRVVFGDEAAGTGAVRIGSIGSQYGGFSQMLNTTTIVGGTVQVVQPVDVAPLAIYLELIARGTGAPGSGSVTIDAPLNQTEGERSAWVRLESAGSIALNAPVWADQIVSLTTTAGGTITQTGSAAAITATALAVDADGGVTLADSGNAFAIVAIRTTNDSMVLREDSGYSISQLTTIDDGRDARPTATVTGIDTGTGAVRLVTISGNTASTVGQGRAIRAGDLGLEGAGTDWSLSFATNDIATLAGDTGSIVFRDLDDLTIGTVDAVTPRAALSGITVERTLAVAADTTLAIIAAGDIVSAVTSGTAVTLSAPSGISTAGDVVTEGGNVFFNHATTLTGDIVLDLEDGPNRGLVTFADAVDGTTSGGESLTIGGDLDASASLGSAMALASLSVSGDSTLTGGITLRTTGNQTYSGRALSTGTITIQGGAGSTVAFQGDVSLGGLVTATADATAYSVALTGSTVSITNAVTFANTGTVTLGEADTHSSTFTGGLTSTAPALTNLAGTIATTNANASFGTTALTADTTVSTGSGTAMFTSAVDGGQALAVNAAGTTTFGGTVGYTTPLASLVTDAAGTTRLNGSIVKTSGAAGMAFNDPVLLGAITDLTADNQGVITFASTLDEDYSLVARTAGITTFGGAVGGTTALVSLATDADGTTSVTGRVVRTTGNQTYADLLTFEPVVEGDAFDLEVLLPADEDADLDSSFIGPPTTRLAGAIVSALDGIAGGGHNLVIEGNAVFGDQPGSLIPDEIADAVDPVAGLNDLRVTGTTTVNSTLIASTGLQTFESGVILGSDVFFLGSGQRFESTVTGIGRAIRVVSGEAGIVFDGDVGTAAEPLGQVSAIAFGGDVRINAAIYAVNQVSVFSVFGSVIGGENNAIHAPGTTIKLVGLAGIGVGTPIAVKASSVSATSTGGDVRLRGIGDLVVGEEGWSANGTIDVDASGEIRVPGGHTIKAPSGVTTTKPIRWGLLGTADSGPGSLRDVVGQANATRAPGIVEFGSARATFTLQSQLPDVSTSLVIDGGGRVTIDGGRRAAHGLSFVAGSAGSQLRGVAVRNFTNFGIRLLDSPGVTVSEVTVTSLNTATSMGLYATGNLAGTTIVSSRFAGGLRGALLVNARSLTFGRIGQGNTFVGNRSVPGSQFAGTGIRAEGNCARTVVEGNTFTQNNYGFAFINARKLRLSRNVFTRNNVAGVLIEGNNLGSVSTGNTFGTGSEKNGRDVQRVRGAQGL